MLGALALLVPLALPFQHGEARTLDTRHEFSPPTTLADWEARRATLRTQVLVAAGLWPLPPRTPLDAQVRGAIARDGYTVEHVAFASLPGHYVTGNLYRPTGELAPGARRAAVLSPHGHWTDGRFVELDDESGNDRWPLQARCAQLARLGCVVFHYDMVGYGDSTSIPHDTSFADAEALANGASLLGLQLWNSIRALDFLCALPDVDPARVGVTGASGGGTQTLLLCAVDDRPAAAFPAVMVSNRMQGGCVCENAPYLRLGTDNVELAALFAPKPLALSGANDWTIAIETEGLPELKHVWRLYGAEERVTARAWPALEHNFAQPSRLMMYAWFDEHLALGAEPPIVEAPLVPLTRAELHVFDDAHPPPADEGGIDAVRAWWRALAAERLHSLPRDDVDGRLARRAARRTALRALGATMPPPDEVVCQDPPLRAVFAVGPDGDPEYERLVAALAARGFVHRVPMATEAAGRDAERHARYAGYSWAYNPPPLLARAGAIHQALTGWRGVRLLAYGAEARAAALAVAVHAAEERWPVERALFVAADLFDAHVALDDRDLLPGAPAFGGLAGALALGAPYELAQLARDAQAELQLAFVGPASLPGELVDAYAAARAARDLRLLPAADDALLEWLAAP